MTSINTMIVGWNYPKSGREAQAGELFQAYMNFWKQKTDQGVIDSAVPVLMTAHGGDFNGFFFVQGKEKKLQEMRASDEFRKLVMQGALILNGFGVIDGYSGNEVHNVMKEWTQLSR